MSLLESEHRGQFEKIFTHYKEELGQLRTGRASGALVENIPVQAYGSTMPIKALGNINVPDAKTVVIDPWDKSLLKDVEKAITDARIGVNPVIDGAIIRLSFPPMTEESRKQVVKILKQKSEETRIAIRQVREAIKEEIAKKEQANEIAEDQRFKMQDELDKMVKEFNERIEEMMQEKEKEIMTV